MKRTGPPQTPRRAPAFTGHDHRLLSLYRPCAMPCFGKRVVIIGPEIPWGCGGNAPAAATPTGGAIAWNSEKLFADQPFFQTVARVEQNTVLHLGFALHFNPMDIVNGVAVGIRHDRSLFRVQDIKPYNG